VVVISSTGSGLRLGAIGGFVMSAIRNEQSLSLGVSNCFRSLLNMFGRKRDVFDECLYSSFNLLEI
jgi:hypothetical protein